MKAVKVIAAFLVAANKASLGLGEEIEDAAIYKAPAEWTSTGRVESWSFNLNEDGEMGGYHQVWDINGDEVRPVVARRITRIEDLIGGRMEDWSLIQEPVEEVDVAQIKEKIDVPVNDIQDDIEELN